jgi:hypothetical protein
MEDLWVRSRENGAGRKEADVMSGKQAAKRAAEHSLLRLLLSLYSSLHALCSLLIFRLDPEVVRSRQRIDFVVVGNEYVPIRSAVGDGKAIRFLWFVVFIRFVAFVWLVRRP